MKHRMLLWIVATRNSFVSLLPLIFLRVTIDLLVNFPSTFFQGFMNDWLGDNWKAPLGQIGEATFNFYALALTAIISVQLVYRLNSNNATKSDAPTPLMVAISAAINFIIFISLLGYSAIAFSLEAMVLAIILGIATAELISWLTHKRLLDLLHLSVESDTAFYNAMRLTPTIVLVGVFFFLLAAFIAALPDFPSVYSVITHWAQKDGYGAWILSTLAVLVNQGLWFIGIHGGLAIDPNQQGPFFISASTVFSADWVSRPIFQNFVLIGGSGATLGLIIAILLTIRQGVQNKVAKISLIPSLFNINDILIYGLPIVLNPRYLIPFLMVPLLLMGISLLAFQSGFISVVNPSSVTWTTPPLLSAWLLTGSWYGVALQLLEIVISTLLYLPFVRKAELYRQQQERLAFEEATHTIINSGHAKQQIISRQDKVGMIARDLMYDLRQAIYHNELTVVYQPKHNRVGHIIGVEALVRWTHPRYGFVSPAMLVMLAEDSGDISQLDQWVFEQCCITKAKWNAMGHQDLTMAINISPLQLNDDALPFFLANCVAKYGLNPQDIELEITESSEISDSKQVEKILQEISDIGIHLAMDDFGMGYSSLLYMRRFKVNAIKIDGSITRDVLTNTTNADIIRTISNLGKAQQVSVVAEYVETIEQREALAEMGCDIFQGYYHSPPLKPEDCQVYFLSHCR
ncbi:diguanylate phosphodiesterase [Methylophaga sulfidovorans]|uniref:Diguanylate phosphodiesterase n=2 Tax=Methylophaga sulfidovorans TaxID=45496 RepID=A0A1I4A6K6_9GAMM|nr:diguanylate phosphodiesterase [Methylophaga sulfidovorans]